MKPNEIETHPVDNGRLAALLGAELRAFLRDFDRSPVAIDQDLRGGLLAWISVFLPEAVPTRIRTKIEETCRGARDSASYRTNGWFRLPYLDVAQFALSGEYQWLQVIVQNLGHMNSSLRMALLPPLALVIDRVDIDLYGFADFVASNLRQALFYNDALLALFAAARAPASVKRERLDVWRREIKLAPQDVERLDRLIDDGLVENTLVCEELLLINQYLFTRLLASTHEGYLENEQIFLFDAQETENMNANAAAVKSLEHASDALALWERMRLHPLNTPLVRLPAR